MTAISSRPLTVNDAQFEEAKTHLGGFVSIPSVSHPTSPYYSMQTLEKASKYIGNKLADVGCAVRYVPIEGSAPFVIAKIVNDAALPTLVLYAHYDVQPVDESKWNTKPFEMVEKQGRLYGRGASDDKAGAIGILTALKVYQAAGVRLPVNVTVFLEGEEEYGSSHMGAFLKQESGELQGEALVVLDSINRDVDTGTLASMTRGVAGLSVTVKALEQSIHSGLGCLAPDPASALIQLLDTIATPTLIPGVLGGIDKPSAEELTLLAQSSVSSEQYAQDVKALKGTKLRGDPSLSVYERIQTTPSISILNISAGQPGGGNSIQAEAHAEIGIRPLPGQDPDQVANAVKSHLMSKEKPFGVQLECQPLHAGAKAWKADLTGPFSKAYMSALGEAFPKSAAMPLGGTIPLMSDFRTHFPQMELILPGVEDPATNAHSHNESQSITVFRNTIDALLGFIEKSSKLSQSS